MKKFMLIGITGVLASGLAFAAFANPGSAKDEIATAHAHALLSQKADTVAKSHVHLHHVINCLVGPKGTAFDTKAANPCKNLGNGAIPDAAGNKALHAKLEQALATAEAGLKSNDLKTVHVDAAKVAATLQATPAQKTSGKYHW